MQPHDTPRAHNFIDLTGKIFGRLTVLALVGKSADKKLLWLCRCECGNETTVIGRDLKSGHTMSCGCLHIEQLARGKPTHGKVHSPLYTTWSNIVQRCTNPNNPNYHHYGGRGITVCERWRNNFADFLDDIGEPPSTRHSLDRIDNDKGYSPDNVRWATQRQQTRNTRRNLRITHNGQTLCVAEWADHFGMKPMTLYHRIAILQWDVERALTTPVAKKPAAETISFQGEAHSLSEWAIQLGVSRDVLHYRIYKLAWDVERAFTTPVRPMRPMRRR